MLSYCLKCGENTKSTILQVSRAINCGITILSKCVVCDDKKSKFIKKQKVNGLLNAVPLSATLSNNLVIRKLLSAILLSATLLSKIPILGDILFCNSVGCNSIV